MDALSGSVPLDYISRVKSSAPSRTLRPARPSLIYEDAAGLAYQSEIDLEDELEFELDADWIATMLDVSCPTNNCIILQALVYLAKSCLLTF